MIKVNKDLQDVPKSLRVDPQSIRTNPARTTFSRRMELIRQGAYPSPDASRNYDARYKTHDIREKLQLIYHDKCAYCESSQEQLHVEHYRPKRGGYYWLSYSWDNLLLSCPVCNSSKSTIFPLAGIRVRCDITEETISGINALSAQYDQIEKPLLVNPETVTEEELRSLAFTQNGRIFSANQRMSETIKRCDLDRQALRERRQKIWDVLLLDVKDAILCSGGDLNSLRARLSQVITSFKRRTEDPSEPYVAYRRYILTHCAQWIRNERIVCGAV